MIISATTIFNMEALEPLQKMLVQVWSASVLKGIYDKRHICKKAVAYYAVDWRLM